MKTLIMVIGVLMCITAFAEDYPTITAPSFQTGPSKDATKKSMMTIPVVPDLKVNWLGSPVVESKRWPGEKAIVTSIEIGLREDGVVVWREIKQGGK